MIWPLRPIASVLRPRAKDHQRLLDLFTGFPGYREQYNKNIIILGPKSPHEANTNI